MGSKCRGNPGCVFFQIEYTSTRHPFMKLCNNPWKLTVISGKALDYFRGSITEQCRFNIIPLSRNAVKLICFPESGEYFILLTEIRLSLIHISEPTRRTPISYAVF